MVKEASFLEIKRPGGETDQTPHLQPKLRMSGDILPFHTCLHGMLRNTFRLNF